MKLNYTETTCTNPYINLATEEYLTFRAKEEEVTLYLWQNANTVVIGRNQNPWRECKVEAMKEGGCHLARRLSGGGAVYHDLGNLNFTFIAREDAYDVSKQTEVILEAVRLLGINAEKTGRNDLTIDGMKFSGHAYYRSQGYCYHHGTIMVHVDPKPLGDYLSVSRAKLRSKGVSSVRSRITNLIDHRADLSIDAIKAALLEAFGRVYGETPVPFAIPEQGCDPALDELIARYSSEEWRYGDKIPFDVEISERLDCGGVDIELKLTGAEIKHCAIFTDALETDIFRALGDRITGTRYTKADLAALDLADLCHNSTEEAIAHDVRRLIAEGIE